MDLKAIGFNYNTIAPSNQFERSQRNARRSKATAEVQQSRPRDKSTSIANKDKGRIIDVSL